MGGEAGRGATRSGAIDLAERRVRLREPALLNFVEWVISLLEKLDEVDPFPAATKEPNPAVPEMAEDALE